MLLFNRPMFPVLLCLAVLFCGIAARPLAAADVHTAGPGAGLEADALEPDEIGVRLLALNDACDGVALQRLDIRRMPRLVERIDPRLDALHAVHTCRAPPAPLAS